MYRILPIRFDEVLYLNIIIFNFIHTLNLALVYSSLFDLQVYYWKFYSKYESILIFIYMT